MHQIIVALKNKDIITKKMERTLSDLMLFSGEPCKPLYSAHLPACKWILSSWVIFFSFPKGQKTFLKISQTWVCAYTHTSSSVLQHRATTNRTQLQRDLCYCKRSAAFPSLQLWRHAINSNFMLFFVSDATIRNFLHYCAWCSGQSLHTCARVQAIYHMIFVLFLSTCGPIVQHKDKWDNFNSWIHATNAEMSL